MRGQAADYDHWRQLGLTGWGWDDVLPVFRRLEDHFLGDERASRHRRRLAGRAPRLSLGDARRRRATPRSEMGIRRIADFNTGDNEGVGYFHVNQKRGRRWSSARGFLKPALKRPNLRLETGRPGRARDRRGRPRASACASRRAARRIEARAQGEVILCAGAVGSPADPAALRHRRRRNGWRALGIAMVLDRPGVGEQPAGPSAAARDLQGRRRAAR